MSTVPFLVRAWPTNSGGPVEDFPEAEIVGALSTAHALATDPKYRQVQVVSEPDRRLWAEFTLLWQVLPGPVGESEGDHAERPADPPPALG